tara:strand:+ start:633 stop:737 length:105 start_codon:yes stop_codon:yes gene_type:complete
MKDLPDWGYFVIGTFIIYQMVISYRIMILLEAMV